MTVGSLKGGEHVEVRRVGLGWRGQKNPSQHGTSAGHPEVKCFWLHEQSRKGTFPGYTQEAPGEPGGAEITKVPGPPEEWQSSRRPWAGSATGSSPPRQAEPSQAMPAGSFAEGWVFGGCFRSIVSGAVIREWQGTARDTSSGLL